MGKNEHKIWQCYKIDIISQYEKTKESMESCMVPFE